MIEPYLPTYFYPFYFKSPFQDRRQLLCGLRAERAVPHPPGRVQGAGEIPLLRPAGAQSGQI